MLSQQSAQLQDARNEVPFDRRNAPQEPFSRSEDAFRFGKLQQQNRALPQNDSSSKYSVFHFGIPTHVSPAAVAFHFPNASSHFPSSQLITAQVPIDREEATRFDVLRARRAAIAPYENARHEAATFRRNDIIRRELMSQQRAELKRLEKINFARERKGHSETVNNFGLPTHVSIAAIASHFPYASSHFPMAGQSKVPIAFEQAHRFDGLAARREALASREADRFDAAAERREAILVHRQSILEDKDRMRQEKVEKAKARRAKFFADAMAAQRQMQQQQQLPAPTLLAAANNTDNVLSRDIPPTLAEDKSMPMEPVDSKSFFVCFALPETVRLADVERHFPHAAAAMHEFESEDCKKAQKDTSMAIPREEEEAHRFELVPVRRAAMILRDKKRQDESVLRGTGNVETRRFVAKNESLMRARRVFNKDNAGWMQAVSVTTEKVKDVKEHGTWSNVAKHDHTTVYVDSKLQSHVDSKTFTSDTTDREAILHQHQSQAHVKAAPTQMPESKPATHSAHTDESKAHQHHEDAILPRREEKMNETIVQATRDETGKPLIDETVIANASSHPPQQSELTVISFTPAAPSTVNNNSNQNSAPAVHNQAAPVENNSHNNNHDVPVHKRNAISAAETKVKPRKFCC